MRTTPEEVYSFYPRKVARGAALKAIRKAFRIIDPVELLAIVKVYAEKIAWKERHFIPHCSTWMNAERWADDPIEWEPPTQAPIPAAVNDKLSTWEVKTQVENLQAQLKDIDDKASWDAMGPMLDRDEKAKKKSLHAKIKQLREEAS